MDTPAIIELYASIISSALPFCLIFFLGDLIVSTFLRVAFGGKFTFRS